MLIWRHVPTVSETLEVIIKYLDTNLKTCALMIWDLKASRLSWSRSSLCWQIARLSWWFDKCSPGSLRPRPLPRSSQTRDPAMTLPFVGKWCRNDPLPPPQPSLSPTQTKFRQKMKQSIGRVSKSLLDASSVLNPAPHILDVSWLANEHNRLCVVLWASDNLLIKLFAGAMQSVDGREIRL